MNEPPVVLLVDDEPRVLSALRRTLRREGLAPLPQLIMIGHVPEKLKKCFGG